MANKSDYIARVQVALMQLHNCGAKWIETAPVHEVFRGQTVWKGEVEVFDLTGHPKAKRARHAAQQDTLAAVIGLQQTRGHLGHHLPANLAERAQNRHGTIG